MFCHDIPLESMTQQTILVFKVHGHLKRSLNNACKSMLNACSVAPATHRQTLQFVTARRVRGAFSLASLGRITEPSRSAEVQPTRLLSAR
jgi:hypothetical protein